jgi:glycosyltransferase involved in cell wall biosynthesis
MHIGLLTGGDDKHYAVGLASALASEGVRIDFIGSDNLDCPEVRVPGMRFLNLRGEQSENAALPRKMVRILKYYVRLISYAAVARPKILHILWNNKFDVFDRTLLMAYYRMVGKRVALTAHNVNGARRDQKDRWVNRMSLRIQYRLCDCIFVHTERMKRELVEEFGVSEDAVRVIPYGINVTIPTSSLTAREARARFQLQDGERVALFFGQIAPYKGLEYLVDALSLLVAAQQHVRLIVAGKVKRGWAGYWRNVQDAIANRGIDDRVIQRIQFIHDEDIEQYFKAADVLVLPYTDIFQSGVLFLAYSFGLPVIATDVGSLREDVIDGRTGLVCRPRDPVDLARSIERYFASDLYRTLETRRADIRRLADERHSWTRVGQLTRAAYARLLGS